MAGRLRLSGAGWPWMAASAGLAGASLLAWWLPAAPLDWQPARAFGEPWRWWTAAFVHWSPQHLGANVGAALMVGAFGLAGRIPVAGVWAWAAAWPLTHLLLLVQPALLHYGGLSGLLHAGVATALLWLLVRGDRGQRVVAALVTTGLLVKLWSEAPWGAPLRHEAEWDIATAPLGHATGALAGAACTAVALWLSRVRQPPRESASTLRATDQETP